MTPASRNKASPTRAATVGNTSSPRATPDHRDERTISLLAISVSHFEVISSPGRALSTCRSHIDCFHGKEIKPEFQRPTHQAGCRCRDWRSRGQPSRRARRRNRRRSRGSRDGLSRRAGRTRRANASCGCRDVCRKAGEQNSCRQGGQVAHRQSRSSEEDHKEKHRQEDVCNEDQGQENCSEKTGGEEVSVKTGREVQVRKEVGPPIINCPLPNQFGRKIVVGC